MDAESRLRRFCVRVLAGFLICCCGSAYAANFRTQNFIIHAPTDQLARAVGESAEKYRHDLAIHWLGSPIRPWPAPCPIRVVAGPRLAAQGVTTYNRSPVRDFQMEVVGTPERILDSVLPHEVTHTILATHFGRPLPRWADEGICTTVEHISERSKHEAKLREFLSSRRGIAMNKLFLLTEYPNDVLPMYAQGYSVCRFLIGQKDPQTFIQFLHDYMQHPSWTANIKKHYQYDSLAELQQYWLAWVAAGSGPVEKFAKVQPVATPPVASLASNTAPNNSVAGNSVAGNSVAGNSTLGNPRGGGATIQASATTPMALSGPLGNLQRQQPVRQPASAGNGTTLASTGVQGGWYKRKRSEVMSQVQPGSNVATAVEAIVPPSVRDSGRYSSAQPQPEQQISRGGVPAARVIDGGGVIRRFR